MQYSLFSTADIAPVAMLNMAVPTADNDNMPLSDVRAFYQLQRSVSIHGHGLFTLSSAARAAGAQLCPCADQPTIVILDLVRIGEIVKIAPGEFRLDITRHDNAGFIAEVGRQIDAGMLRAA